MSEPATESRVLEISDFRNIGITDPSGKTKGKAVLKLNRSLERGQLGGLVILLGSNNSGKSNVLNALTKVRRGEFGEEDYTDFMKVRQNPSLSFRIANGRYGEISSPEIVPGMERCTMQGRFGAVLLYLLKQKESFTLWQEYYAQDPEKASDIERYMDGNEAFVRSIGPSEDYKAYAYILGHRQDIQCGELASLLNALESDEYDSIKNREIVLSAKGTAIDEVILVDNDCGKIGDIAGIRPRYIRRDRLEEYESSRKGIKAVMKKTASFINIGKKNDDAMKVRILDFSGGIKETQTVKDAFSDRYGYNLSSNVYQYNRRKISDTDFETTVDNPQGFIPNLFANLGYNPTSILSEEYLSSTDTVEKLEREINEDLAGISETFNKLLNFNNRPYSMSLRIGDRKIAFTLKCSDTKLRINHQSEGFRWVFEFFFNFLLSKKFTAGDMVVIDEFGNLLNPGTVRELTSSLREFGKNNGVTFVLATQNPMAVDTSHLEEIRIIAPQEDGSVTILNDFPEFINGKSDVLEPITGCLTVSRNYLRNPGRSTVFVDNARNYFLLSAFSNGSGIDLEIIPVENKGDAKAFAESLVAVERKPVLVVDNLPGPEDAETLSESGVTVCSPRDLNRENITSLLSAEDAARLPEFTEFDNCVSLINTHRYARLSEESRNNVREFLEYVSL